MGQAWNQINVADQNPTIPQNRNHGQTNDSLELLWCFDSNGRYIDRKRLWKKNGSEYRQCGNLHKLAKQINELPYKSLRYIFLSVGTNDLDDKDHDQVIGELQLLIDDTRKRYPGIKFIINEFLPRGDERNTEVGKFNTALNEFGSTQPDITIASQQNMYDSSMFYDTKHLRESKVPLYAKNIIRAMLKAYRITDKKELFVPAGEVLRSTSAQPTMTKQRLHESANYDGSRENTPIPNAYPDRKENKDKENKEMIIRNALMQFSEVLVKCIQR